MRKVLLGAWWIMAAAWGGAMLWSGKWGQQGERWNILLTLFGLVVLGWIIHSIFPKQGGGYALRFPSAQEHPMRYAYIYKAALPAALCNEIIECAERGTWTTQRHTQPTQDQPLAQLGPLAGRVEHLLHTQLLPTIAARYELPPQDVGIREAFVVKYDPRTQQKLDLHRDASILTLSIALNRASAYTGGGTYFPCLERAIRLKGTGDLLVHCGKIQHGGGRVVEGVRYLLVCFLDCSACSVFDHEDIATWDSAWPSDKEVMQRIYRREDSRASDSPL